MKYINILESKLNTLKAWLIENKLAAPEELEANTVENTYNSSYESFEIIGNKYKVLTEDDAHREAEKGILNSLWAFNADFIITHTAIWDNITNNEATDLKKAVHELQATLCENANLVIKSMIADIDDFITDAINAYGMGRFISYNDGEEYKKGEFYIYRIK